MYIIKYYIVCLCSCCVWLSVWLTLEEFAKYINQVSMRYLYEECENCIKSRMFVNVCVQRILYNTYYTIVYYTT